MQVGLLMPPPYVPSALSGVLSYRKREHVCCGTLTHYLYDRTPLMADQELHFAQTAQPSHPPALISTGINMDQYEGTFGGAFLPLGQKVKIPSRASGT